MPPVVLREHTLDLVDHPEYLRLPRRGGVLQRIDDPLVAPIRDGYPPLGWEGDARYALYADPQRKSWVLVRLEGDGVYRPEAETTFAAAGVGAIDVVGQLLQFLVSHDTRRGYDVVADVDAHNAALDREQDRVFSDRVVNDLAPRLRHALRKDGVDGWH